MKTGDKVKVRNLFSNHSLNGKVSLIENNVVEVETEDSRLKRMIFDNTRMCGLGRFGMWIIEGVIA